MSVLQWPIDHWDQIQEVIATHRYQLMLLASLAMLWVMRRAKRKGVF